MAEVVSALFREIEESVKRLIRMRIGKAQEAGRKVGICGEAPSDDPEVAAFLVDARIKSISLVPDSVMKVIKRAGQVERGSRGGYFPMDIWSHADG